MMRKKISQETANSWPNNGDHFWHTHFLFSDLNNAQVADHIAHWLQEKGLD